MKHVFELNEGNGGESISLTTTYEDNGDGELFSYHELEMNSYGNSASIFIGSYAALTPAKLRKLADELEELEKSYDPDAAKWEAIKQIGWSEENSDYRKLAKQHSQWLDKSLKEFSVQKRKQLQSHLKAVESHKLTGHNWYENWQTVRGEPMSDDGFWDMTANVVGHGRDAFESVLENPLETSKYGRVENFEYIFSFLEN